MTNLPGPEDYIDIHNHGGAVTDGVFSVENLLANEEQVPEHIKGMAFTIGIHPWHLTPDSYNLQIGRVRNFAGHDNIIALGEAGFDRLKGPSGELQERAFLEQIKISELYSKPMYIHCVRAWEELVAVHKKMKPAMLWLVHGFRGRKELAMQLVARGMYISFWFEFILRPESSELVKSLPRDRIFLETDGSGISIAEIYGKVAADLMITDKQLKIILLGNFRRFFNV